ncbi:inner centromere protein A isoform X2 [Nothobranchius furzeri]|uniref:Inner centromere protein n=2 Tax=Nothobranchius furzeri TaxID=105023 RepID=A0A9D3BVP2_NOTFU|nr:inner centromere protein A isoform X2 [Nothobranchius furzeri]KAF7224287.1 inner centromere protein [Nothobranchius furzeri]
MTSVLSSVRSLMGMFDDKVQEFVDEINNVHIVWLEEIQQEANRMFSRDFNTEPELMPKTPSQKRNTRRKRVSLSRQEANQTRFSKGKRSNLRGSAVQTLKLIAEDEVIPEASTSNSSSTTRPKRATRRNKQAKLEVALDESQTSCNGSKTEPEQIEEEVDKSSKVNDAEVTPAGTCSSEPSPPQIPTPEIVVSISREERLSAELAVRPKVSPGRTAIKIAITDSRKSSRRSSVRHSLKLRHSLAGLRHSMTQEAVRRASRRSMLKKKSARVNISKNGSSVDGESSIDTVEEDNEDVPETADADAPEKSEKTSEPLIIGVDAAVKRITRSVAANAPKLAPPSLLSSQPSVNIPVKNQVVCGNQQTSQEVRRSSRKAKRKSPVPVEDSPTKRFSPLKKSQSAIKPNMKSFLHTVHKNQMLMMTPNSFGRTTVIKSFIRHTTPLKVDPKTKERHKLEALKKKQEQEEERMRKMEEDKKRKQEELRRKRDERIKRVLEAKVKEEQKEEEKKKKIEQKMAQIDEKNDKRQAEERTKKRLALKKQEELEQKRKLEEEAKKKKMQQAEEEKHQQELAAKKKAEEEEQQARKELELKKEQERERERRAAAERERLEKERALALQHALERAAREKEMRELEEKRKVLEEKRKLEEQQRLAAEKKALKEREEANKREAAVKQAMLNVTVDLEHSVMSTPVGKAVPGLNVTVDVEPSSPQSYAITPKGGNKPVIISKNADDYGMDQNSDDSTDDESAPRKPIPSWAEGSNLRQIIMKQYFNPPDLHALFGAIEPPKLENIFYKSKPRYFKRTSSAVWHSPPK